MLSYKIDVRVSIKQDTKHGQYNDSLYFPYPEKELQDFISKNSAAIESQGQARIDNWIYSLEHPATYIEPSKEELLSLIDSREKEITEWESKIEYTDKEIEAKKAELQAKLDELTKEVK